jgi:hypothetical protein
MDKLHCFAQALGDTWISSKRRMKELTNVHSSYEYDDKGTNLCVIEGS